MEKVCVREGIVTGCREGWKRDQQQQTKRTRIDKEKNVGIWRREGRRKGEWEEGIVAAAERQTWFL